MRHPHMICLKSEAGGAMPGFAGGFMRYALLRATFVLSFLSAISLWGQSRLVVPDSSVGRNLQASARVALPEFAPEPLEIAIRSSDPAKLLIASDPTEA